MKTKMKNYENIKKKSVKKEICKKNVLIVISIIWAV